MNSRCARPLGPGLSPRLHAGFTLTELLVVMAVIGILIGLTVPALSRARLQAHRAACLSNLRQVGLAAQLYMGDYGGLFHHHEAWVLDDGTQVESLPANPQDCAGGGAGNSHAEKPWVIFFQPYLNNRRVGFCPADRTPRSHFLATSLRDFNGGIADVNESPPPQSELAIARGEFLTTQSYLLNSVFTHRSCRYALEGALPGFATDAVVSSLPNPNFIMFSERNSEALNARENGEYGNVGQDDYDTWAGEGALVRWGAGPYGDQGWIRHDRHGARANYVYTDGHVETLRWRQARADQFPDHVVRGPLLDPL